MGAQRKVIIWLEKEVMVEMSNDREVGKIRIMEATLKNF